LASPHSKFGGDMSIPPYVFYAPKMSYTIYRRGGVPTLPGSGGYLDLHDDLRDDPNPGNGGPWEWRALTASMNGNEWMTVQVKATVHVTSRKAL
jgi:hypothetical protein